MLVSDDPRTENLLSSRDIQGVTLNIGQKTVIEFQDEKNECWFHEISSDLQDLRIDLRLPRRLINHGGYGEDVEIGPRSRRRMEMDR